MGYRSSVRLTRRLGRNPTNSGAGFVPGPSRDPARFWVRQSTRVAPTSTRKWCPLLCGLVGRRGKQREAHFATVSPGVLQATPGATPTSPCPTQWNFREPPPDAVTMGTAPAAWGDQTNGSVGRRVHFPPCPLSGAPASDSRRQSLGAVPLTQRGQPSCVSAASRRFV